MINDYHQNAFDDLLESVKNGGWECELRDKTLQGNIFRVRNGKFSFWVANGMTNLYLDFNENSIQTYHFTLMQKWKLWRLLKPIIKDGNSKRRMNNACVFLSKLPSRQNAQGGDL